MQEKGKSRKVKDRRSSFILTLANGTRLNLCAGDGTAYLLHASLDRAFWKEIERAILQRAAGES